jgi:dihydropteroate synthase
MYVVLRHRAWFLELTHNVYENRPLIALAEQTKKKRIKAFLMEKWWNISI